MGTDNETLVKALRILVNDIQTDDGVANACIAEAAFRIEDQRDFIDALKKINFNECVRTKVLLEALNASMNIDWLHYEKERRCLMTSYSACRDDLHTIALAMNEVM